MAIVSGVEKAVQIHIDRGDNLNARDRNGMTPLMLSAARNKHVICKLLLNAGADTGLQDFGGRTAYAIAVASGAQEAATVLGVGQGGQYSENFQALGLATEPFAERALSAGLDTNALVPQEAPKLIGLGIDPRDEPALDLSGWEAEEESVPPEVDTAVEDVLRAIQAAIAAHDPIDSSSDWDNIDVFLPDAASLVARVDDEEARARLRLLLLRAIREGSVPTQAVQALSANSDLSPNQEAEAVLTMFVNDLGAEVDERFEYADFDESFEVFVDPDETPSEEELIDDALANLDLAISGRSDPLNMYQRDCQRSRRISAAEEIELGQAMENALEAALDALATWPQGVCNTLAAGAEVNAGFRQLASMSIAGVEPEVDVGSVDGRKAATAEIKVEIDLDESEGDFSGGAVPGPKDIRFADTLIHLGALKVGAEVQGPIFQSARTALADLRLNRRFLIELGDIDDPSEACFRYRQAIKAYCNARNRMATANWKLAFYLAKRYIYSGEPLVDLAQEGNIGLLKAVDRFDWRRGFRFSTMATWWIRQQIARYVADKVSAVRVPVHVYEKLQRLKRETQAFESTFCRPPTIEEMAVCMEMPAHTVAKLQRVVYEFLPIDELIDHEAIAIEFRDNFAWQDPADGVSALQLVRGIDKLLRTMEEKEESVIRLRFGVGVPNALTLEEIGQWWGVTRERIRQIEVKALRKLRHPSRRDTLAQYAIGILTVSDGCDGADERQNGASNSRAIIQNEEYLANAPQKPGMPLKAMSLDLLLSQATDLGVSIDDDRDGLSGLAWVHLVETPDDSHRSLARKLIQHGFQFFPKKGYSK